MGKPLLLNLRVFRRRDRGVFHAGLLPALLCACVLTAPQAADAAEVAALYTAQVVLDPDEKNPRQVAYKDALNEVLLRVSGADLVADPAMVELLFPDPAAYVIQFRPGDDDTLWVSFDGDAVENVLRNSGQTVWGSDRPVTLVWLAVDWGQGDREIIAAEDPDQRRAAGRPADRDRLLREQVLDMAERRGLPVIFPLMDSMDQRNVSFSDIWGGFDEQLLAASERYEVSSILVGRIPASSGQRNRWSYFFAGEQQVWNGEPETVISLVADQLASEFAIHGDAPLEAIELRIAGIDSVEAYGEMQNLLASTSVIENFAIDEVSGDVIRYRIEALGGVERLRRALRFGGLIEQNGADGSLSPVATLDFFYSPKR